MAEILTLYRSVSSVESTHPRTSTSTSIPRSKDVATSSPISEPDAASSCGDAQALTPLPTVIVSSAVMKLSVSLFSATISSLSKTMNTLYSPSTMFDGTKALNKTLCVALIAKPEDHVVLPRLWSTHELPESTLRIASTMNGSAKSSVPSLITVILKSTISPGFAA